MPRLWPLLLLAACRATAPAAHLAKEAPALAPVPSPGCAAPQDPPQGERRLTSGGRTRRFRLVVPPGLGSAPAPLVLNFHGLMEPPKLQQLLSGMDAEAARRGMIVAYPEGVGTSWNGGTCCGRAQAEGVDDVRFARDLVRELGRELCLDRRRIYATGMSNGAIFSYRLACEASDLIAAIAPVAGTEAAASCTPARPVPVIAFNGTSDLLVTWKGGWFGLQAPQATIAHWAERNRCGPAHVAYQHGDARCEAHSACAADVVLCSIDGGGHTWPGGTEAFFLGKTSSDLDATATLLDFFLAHPHGD